MKEIEHPQLLVELRSQIRNGETAVAAMRLLISRLHLGPDSRQIVILYFQTAFGLPPRNASLLTAWEFFDGAAWPEDAVNAELTPVLSQCLKT